MQGQKQERLGGWSLIVAVALGLFVVGMHPTGHDLHGPGSDLGHAALLNRAVHGAGIAMCGVLFVGLLALRRVVGGAWSDLALIAQGIGLLGALLAATASGFVQTPLFEAMAAAGESEVEVLKQQVRLTHLWNQAFAGIYAMGFSLGMLIWARDLRLHGRGPARAGWFGTVVGLTICGALLGGHLRLDVHGFGMVFLGHAIWLAWIGVLLIRAKPQQTP